MKKILNICKKEYADFDRKYMVFQMLRDKGYIVSPGIKFGCDFAVYERGPGIDYAPVSCTSFQPSDSYDCNRYRSCREAGTTVKKQFILAIPKLKEKTISFVGFDWWRA